MPSNPGRRKRVKAENSDTEDKYDVTSNQATDNARDNQLRRLQELDLGTIRTDKIKSDDRPQRREDRANVQYLLGSRDVNQEGTEANTLYKKNKSAIAAWNNPNNVVDNHEEDFDQLDGGHAHRQRMRNQYGGRVNEPDDYEAGYTTRGGRGGRARGAGFTARGGRGGSSSIAPHASSHGRASIAGGRAGIAAGPQASTPSRGPSNQTASYRPLDPAIDPDDDPRSKYAKSSTHSGTSAGRGGGNAGRGVGHAPSRADFNARVVPTPPSTRPRPTVDLTDHDHFMAAVRAMNDTKKAASKTATTTTAKVEKSATVKPTLKGLSTVIESKWGDPVKKASTAAKPPPKSQPPPVAQAPTASSNIRQVPTNEFSLPPPHRGDSMSWTDGIPSTHLSSVASPAVFSQADPSEVAQGTPTGVGLGIEGIDTPMEDDTTAGVANISNVVDLMDITENEDLKALQEAPVATKPLAERIMVGGKWYILDKSVLGNAATEEVIDATSVPSLALTPSRSSDATTSTEESKKAKATGMRKVTETGAQTTPSLTQCNWATSAPLRLPQVSNPFASDVAPPRAIVLKASTSKAPSAGEFTAIFRHRSEEVSSFLIPELTSPDGVESVASTPNLASSKCGRADAKVSANTSGRLESPGWPKSSSFSRPKVIDNIEWVRLQTVGNASFGMTPFQPQLSASTPKPPSRPPHIRRQSTATSVASDATASTARDRGLTASKYASGDVASPTETSSLDILSLDILSLDALSALSMNSPVRLRGGETTPKPPSSTATFGTGNINSRWAVENTSPHPPSPRTTSGVRPIRRPTTMRDGQAYKPISQSRTPVGDGFVLLQAEIAAAGPLYGASFSSAPSTKVDESDESEL